MSTFAELLEQVNARYEADMAKLLARCHTLDDLGERLGGLTFEMDEKVKRPSQAGSQTSMNSMPTQKSAMPWATIMPDLLDKPKSKRLNALSSMVSCCDLDALLSRSYMRFVLWWTGLKEPTRSGCLYNIIESKPFRAITWLAIVINTAVVTLMTDWTIQNGQQGEHNMPMAYVWVDVGCLACYIIELVLYFLVHRLYFFVNENAGWNILHLVLVIFSILDLASHGGSDETGTVMYMRSLRFCRVTKAFRIFRVMSSFHELASMLRSFTSCLWAMLWSFLLLYLLLFLSALIFAQGISESLSAGEFLGEEEVVKSHFGTVGRTMLSLYMSVTGGADWSLYYDLIERTGFVYPWLWLSYTFLFTFALVNILTALFVEKAVEGAKPEREYRILHERKKLVEQAEELRELFYKIDLDHSGAISFDEFMSCMMDYNIITFMSSLGIEVNDAELLWKLVAGQDGELEIAHFVDTCMAVKGQASTLDIQKQLMSIERVAETLRRWEQNFWPLLVEASNETNEANAASHRISRMNRRSPSTRPEATQLKL